MSRRLRTLSLVIALAVIAVFFVLAGLASANGTTNDKTVCVDGYVINHREFPVDATQLTLTLRVEAIDAAGQTVFADVDEKGYFQFEELAVGKWNFRMQLPESWDGIVPLAARDRVAETGMTELKEKDGCYRIVFKIRRLFDLTVLKWEELLNATVQPGEGWEITATPVKDPYVKAQTETTDENGKASFVLTPGRWIITEKVKPGWIPVTPSQVTIDLDQYALPGAMLPVIFKNREPACYAKIIVHKIGFGTDANNKEIQLGPLAGWKVTVARADNTKPPITKYTDGAGQATFDHLLPGVYTVTEEVKPGWEEMEDKNPQTVILRDCEEVPVEFRNKELAGDLRIYGYKLFKGWEPPYRSYPLAGLSTWVITATLVGTDTEITTTTNALGYYEFTEDALKAADMAFPGATIAVCEEVRDNWIHMTARCVRVKFPYPVPANYTGARVDFTNMQDPPAVGAWTPPTVNSTVGCRAIHVVQRGDTLARIAASYGTTAGAIASSNGIKNANYIRTGQVLCIR